MIATWGRLIQSPEVLRRGMSLWPPYLAAGIKITRMDEDFRHIDVEMALRWHNRNYVGTHFGGSLYAMVDPFYMLMLMRNLGRDYLVWDKAASIDFVSPGRGRVRATFALSSQEVEAIREEAAGGEKVLPEFDVVIFGEEGEVVAKVHKTLYVRRKRV